MPDAWEGDFRQEETEFPELQEEGTRGKEKGTIRSGTVLLHTYKVLSLIGKGGMGTVYKALHLTLGTFHAIKVVRPELISNATARNLFVQEASVLRDIRHDAIAQYDGLFQDENGQIYLVMEFVEGPRLSDILHSQGALTPEEVWRLYGRLARGLGAVHSRGIVHRDISPDNVILPGGKPEQAKLIDFGIATTGEAEKKAEGKTQTFAGKYSYASPEQLGQSDGQVDDRSDIYSLGLVLAASTIGQPLPMGTNRAEAVEARKRKPRLPWSVSWRLRRELKRLLQPDLQRRPKATELVKRDLIRKHKERHPRRGMAAVGYGSAVAVGVGIAGWISGGVSLQSFLERYLEKPKSPIVIPSPVAPPAKPPQAEPDNPPQPGPVVRQPELPEPPESSVSDREKPIRRKKPERLSPSRPETIVRNIPRPSPSRPARSQPNPDWGEIQPGGAERIE